MVSPAAIGAIGGVAKTLLGGIFGRSSAKRQQAYAVENAIESLPRLRLSAEKAGFNPLTALLATGGSGFNAGAPAVAPLASQAVISGAVDGVTDWLTGDAEKQRSRDKVRDDMEKLQLEKMRAGGASKIVVKTSAANTLPNLVTSSPKLGNEATTIQPINAKEVRPKLRPNLWSRGAIPVIGPDGGSMQISRKIGERLKLKPWDAMIIEDNEALYGDEMGQVVSLPKIPAAVIQTEGGVTKQRTPEQREKITQKPWSLKSYTDDEDKKKPTGSSVNRRRQNRKRN